MSVNTKYRKLIEDYFEGNLSSSKITELKNQLEVDPALKSEFDLQNTIVETVREARRMELKSHLNNINIGWHHMIPNSWKVAAGISLLTASSVFAFFMLEDTFNPGNKAIDISQGSTTEQVLVEETIIPQIPESPVIEKESANDKVIIEEIPKELPSKGTIETKITTSKEPVAIITDIPDDFEKISNPDLTPDAVEEMPTFEPVPHSSTIIDMNTINDNKYQFHYTFSEGKLSLYGNFKDSPYEIMELNSANGKQLFLYYKNNYYKLKNNTIKISPLEPVKDSTFIDELDILRLNK